MVTPLGPVDVARLREAPFTYTDVGGSGRGQAGRDGWFEHERTLERRDLDGAARDLFSWRVQERSGLRVFASDTPLVVGTVVLMRLGVGPLALRIPCRVMDVVDQPDVRGFAYGTLPGHPESGEERFLLERLGDGRLRFAVRGFSRPATWPTRLAGPLGRLGQRWMTRRYLRALDHLD